MNSVPGSPRIESRRWVSEKCRCAAPTSARETAARSPQTNDLGNVRSAARDISQNPLASPFAAASHESKIIGAEIGAASDDESMRP